MRERDLFTFFPRLSLRTKHIQALMTQMGDEEGENELDRDQALINPLSPSFREEKATKPAGITVWEDTMDDIFLEKDELVACETHREYLQVFGG